MRRFKPGPIPHRSRGVPAEMTELQTDTHAGRDAADAVVATAATTVFLSWLATQAATFDSIRISTTPHGRSVIAARDIPPRAFLMAIPSAAFLSCTVLRTHAVLGHAFAAHPDVFDGNDDAVLAAGLCYHAALGAASPLAPWLAVMPAELTSLPNWSDAELQLLQDGTLGRLARQAADELLDLTALIVKCVAPFVGEGTGACDESGGGCASGTPPTGSPSHALSSSSSGWGVGFTPARMRWALLSVASRAYGRRLGHACLVPLADMFDHGNVAMKYGLVSPGEAAAGCASVLTAGQSVKGAARDAVAAAAAAAALDVDDGFADGSTFVESCYSHRGGVDAAQGRGETTSLSTSELTIGGVANGSSSTFDHSVPAATLPGLGNGVAAPHYPATTPADCVPTQPSVFINTDSGHTTLAVVPTLGGVDALHSPSNTGVSTLRPTTTTTTITPSADTAAAPAPSTMFVLWPSGFNSYAAGQPVLNSYGRRPNGHLLSSYGFCLADNEWETVTLSCKLGMRPSASSANSSKPTPPPHHPAQQRSAASRAEDTERGRRAECERHDRLTDGCTMFTLAWGTPNAELVEYLEVALRAEMEEAESASFATTVSEAGRVGAEEVDSTAAGSGGEGLGSINASLRAMTAAVARASITGYSTKWGDVERDSSRPGLEAPHPSSCSKEHLLSEGAGCEGSRTASDDILSSFEGFFLHDRARLISTTVSERTAGCSAIACSGNHGENAAAASPSTTAPSSFTAVTTSVHIEALRLAARLFTALLSSFPTTLGDDEAEAAALSESGGGGGSTSSDSQYCGSVGHTDATPISSGSNSGSDELPSPIGASLPRTGMRRLALEYRVCRKRLLAQQVEFYTAALARAGCSSTNSGGSSSKSSAVFCGVGRGKTGGDFIGGGSRSGGAGSGGCRGGRPAIASISPAQYQAPLLPSPSGSVLWATVDAARGFPVVLDVPLLPVPPPVPSTSYSATASATDSCVGAGDGAPRRVGTVATAVGGPGAGDERWCCGSTTSSVLAPAAPIGAATAAAAASFFNPGRDGHGRYRPTVREGWYAMLLEPPASGGVYLCQRR